MEVTQSALLQFNEYFKLFQWLLTDRWFYHLDLPVVLILLTVGLNRKKPAAYSLLMHYILRGIGNIMVYTMLWAWPNPTLLQFRINQTIPLFFCYSGELFIDSYMLHKVRMLTIPGIDAKKSYKWWICHLSYGALVIIKGLNPFLRVYYVCAYPINSDEFNYMLSRMDVLAFSFGAFYDFSCCVTLLSSIKFFQKTGVSMGIVQKLKSCTEYRMVICNALQVMVAILIGSQSCFSSASSKNVCAFTGARDIINTYVYYMYYLDFLIIRLTTVEDSSKPNSKCETNLPVSHINSPQKTNT
ncbi:hypothetical protein BC833DRAFT_597458 [Globomyces pollinis-pini]|nr:hypothetical protein BC833DRAFT_597458 [Globomyces pollinis-pini]